MSEAPGPSLLESLRQNGADQNDPVRFRYLESFEQRLRAKGLHKGTTHWRKLEQAISDYQARLDSAGQRDEPPPMSAAIRLFPGCWTS